MTLSLRLTPRRLLAATLACAALSLSAQQSTPQLSPAAAYQQAIRPVELTHRSIANWSPIEQASLGVAIQQAAAACAARQARDFSGEPLFDLARLCSLGLAWPVVIEATTRYIAEDVAQGAPAKAHLPEVYAGKIDAELHLRDKPAAVEDTAAMLEAVPYNPTEAQAVDEVLDYTHLLFTADAVNLAARRQPRILAALNSSNQISTPELYRQGLTLPALQQLAASPAAAAQSFADLEAALPATSTPDDLIAIAGHRRQYLLLGQPLPEVATVAVPGFSVRSRLFLAPHAVTALLLFPDWCAQCVRLAAALPAGPFTVAGHKAHVNGLLLLTKTPNLTPAKPDTAYDPAFALASLKATPTVPIDPAWLQHVDAADYPLLLVLDAAGTIRLIELAGEDALQPGGPIDSALALVAATWPEPVKSTPKPRQP